MAAFSSNSTSFMDVVPTSTPNKFATLYTSDVILYNFFLLPFTVRKSDDKQNAANNPVRYHSNPCADHTKMEEVHKDVSRTDAEQEHGNPPAAPQPVAAVVVATVLYLPQHHQLQPRHKPVAIFHPVHHGPFPPPRAAVPNITHQTVIISKNKGGGHSEIRFRPQPLAPPHQGGEFLQPFKPSINFGHWNNLVHRPSMITLTGTFCSFNITQQCIHLGQI